MNVGSYNCCTTNKKEFSRVTSLSSLVKLAGETNRLKILCILRTGKHCVCEIKEHVNLSQSLISHHLFELKKAELIVDEKSERRVYYELTEKGKHVTNTLFKLE